MGLVFWLGTGATVLGLAASLFLPRTTPQAASRLPEEATIG
jgi:hypothetical protein